MKAVDVQNKNAVYKNAVNFKYGVFARFENLKYKYFLYFFSEIQEAI
jgi:hypothetical protein